MSVYERESPANLNSALQSVLINQTVKPKQVVLVVDGPIGMKLGEVISYYENKFKDQLKVLSLDKNYGLGSALRKGLLECEASIVARMDTDDISLPTRFEKQFAFLENNLQYDVVGCNIEEFNIVPGDLKRFKYTHEHHEELIKAIKLRSPFNHPSIMFRKASILKAGNYDGDLPLFEDYSLFLKLWQSGSRFYNLQEVLLYFRVGVGIETIKRRSGLHYLKKEWDFVKYAKRVDAFTSIEVLKYVILKFPIRLLPPKIVLFIYNRFLRKTQR
ncbi:glycosyltransferase [Pedobacter namyangjuensis]|uniref:glycosyltransferase n=1 Tax=Pedobacter namyangjuensis TaxID=600626 RepID=UPI001F061002